MKTEEFYGRIEMPELVTTELLMIEKKLNWSVLDPILVKMSQPETWEEGLSQVRAVLGEDQDGLNILCCQLHRALQMKDCYDKLGISEDIYIDTMKFFSRCMIFSMQTTGKYRYTSDWWAVRQLSMTEFRIQTLEYEMIVDQERQIRSIELHIPSDSDLSIQKLKESLYYAREFFRKYYPEYQGTEMYCSSWLLSPALKNLLPADSKIIQFQNSFTILETEENNWFMEWVYGLGSEKLSLEDLPEKTSLQRKLKSYLMQGGKIGWTKGRLVGFD